MSLKFIQDVYRIKDQLFAQYRCHCGAYHTARKSAVTYGNTTSCGCVQGEKHGQRNTPEYESWAHMKQRCNNYQDAAWVDNSGNYEPGNVRWATKKEQANNRRRRTVWKK